MEIQRLLTLNMKDMLNDSRALEMLKTFLKNRLNGDRNLIQLYVEIFEKCQEFSKQTPEISITQFEELCDLGLPYDIEYGKLKMIVGGDGVECKDLILTQLYRKIEAQKEYEAFRKDLLKQAEKC